MAFTLLASVGLVASSQAQQNSSSATQGTAPASSAGKPQSGTKKPATSSKTAAPLTLKTDKQKLSYALGMRMGAGLKKQDVQIDPAILERGLKDALAGGKTLMTEQEMQSAMMQVQNDLRKKQEEKMAAEGVTNKKQGQDFLAENKAKEGIVALPSGLQYKVLKEGDGPKPTASDSVECNYRGTLVNGKEFDSSTRHGGPATFPVNGVIKGWTEALQLMPVGSKWQLFVPSDLAYGDRGAGPDIGPDSTLIFEVELISIKPKDKTPEGAEQKPGDAKNPNDQKPADQKPNDQKPNDPNQNQQQPNDQKPNQP